MRYLHFALCFLLLSIGAGAMGCGDSGAGGPDPGRDVPMETEFEQGSRPIDPENV